MFKGKSGSLGKVISVLMAAVLVPTCVMVSDPTKVLAADFTWSAGSEVTQSVFNNTDSQPGLAKIGNDVWCVVAEPIAGENLPWKVYKGTSIDNLTYQYTGTRNNFPTDYSYNFWSTGMWVDTADNNKWYTIAQNRSGYFK